jgi:hypothetical protein
VENVPSSQTIKTAEVKEDDDIDLVQLSELLNECSTMVKQLVAEDLQSEQELSLPEESASSQSAEVSKVFIIIKY